MNKRAILYARVSTDEQAERGYSVQSQVEALQAYAATHGFDTVAVLREDYTGTQLSRPELDKARLLIKDGVADTIVVYSPDRLTRSLAHALILREEFLTAGVELHYVNRGRSENSAEGRMTENIEAVFAEYWREKIIEANRRGKHTKAKNGRWVGSGRPPYGYRREGKGRDSLLAFHEQEIAVVKRIIDLYLGRGGVRPHYLRGIAAVLTREHVSPPNRGPGNAIGWHQEAVRIILDNRAYLGEFRYAEHVIPLPHLAIIDEATYQAIQERRRQNSVLGSRKRKHEYLLVGGHFKCTCGASMTCRTQVRRGKPYRYYVCWRESERYLGLCHERSVRAEKIDPVVWNWVEQLLSSDDNLEQGLRRMQERHELELGPNRERLQTIRQVMEKTEQKLKRLAKAVSDADNDVVADALNLELKAVGRSLAELNKEAATLEAAISQSEVTRAEIDTIKALATELREELSSPTPETQRYLIDKLKVVVRFRREGDERWIDLTCELAPQPQVYALASGTS